MMNCFVRVKQQLTMAKSLWQHYYLTIFGRFRFPIKWNRSLLYNHKYNVVILSIRITHYHNLIEYTVDPVWHSSVTQCTTNYVKEMKIIYKLEFVLSTVWIDKQYFKGHHDDMTLESFLITHNILLWSQEHRIAEFRLLISTISTQDVLTLASNKQ